MNKMFGSKFQGYLEKAGGSTPAEHCEYNTQNEYKNHENRKVYNSLNQLCNNYSTWNFRFYYFDYN